ncbi:hypothetical protein PAXINDRAFT_7789 [Paxillus involutus ATCC 200175]|nr:hypothetical protein PAXINDRAFT_7789 [Paxillus involutus ATCC 200175]
MAEFPALAVDGRNWSTWRKNLERTLNRFRIGKYLNETTPNPYDARAHALAKRIFALTIHPSLLARIRHLKSVHEGFKTLQNLLEKESTSTTGRLYEIWNDNTKREAAHSPETANDRGDTSRCDDEVRNGSRGSNNHVPRSETRREHEQERRSQGRVEKGPGVGEKGGVSKGEKDDEKVAAVSGVSLVKPTSSQEDLPGTRVDPPRPHHHSKSPSPSPTTHNLLFEQTAPTSRRPTRQRTQQELEEAARRYLARRKREDGEGSRRGDVDVHHADVAPQQPQTVGQTAVDDEAADTTDPHANSAGPAVPVGTTNGPPNESNGGRDRERGRNVEEEDEKGGRASESAALSSNDDGGDEDVRHAYVVPKLASPSPNHVPPPPDESRPPPSTPLEGEKNGQQASGYADDTATHLERPRHKSTTQQPRRTPYDQRSSGEGQGEGVGGDDEVEGNDDRDTEKARDEARDDEEGQQNRERGQTTEERRTAATNANNEDDAPPPQPPSPPTPPALPPHPERHDDDDHTKSNKTAARARADALHDQEGETVSPGSVPPSVRLEGERIRLTSPYVEVDNVEATTPDSKPPSVRLEGESGRRSSLHVETDDVETDDLKTCKTAAQRMCADALHDPGGQTDAPGSQPPSVRLEGEKDKASSLYVEADHVEADDHDVGTVDHDHDTQQSPRRPVGTPDGDKRRPNGPTEPPDEKEGDRGVDSESSRVGGVEGVETQTSRRVDEPGGKGDEGDDEESRSREVEGKEGDQSEDDGCQRDGRTNDAGQQNRERGQTTEERRTAATNANNEDDAPPPQPPSPPTPPALPPHPERHDDDDHTKSNKTAARARADALHDQEGETVSPGSVPPSVRLEGERIRLTSPYVEVDNVEATTPDSKPPSVRLEGESGRRSSLHVETDDVETDDLKTCKTAAQRMCADALHDPGSQTDAPGSQPPSVRLEGEKDKASSLYVEANHVEADDDDDGTVDHDHDTQQSPRRPVGTPDGDKRRPNGPTEPPDEKEGDRGVDGESSRVGGVEGVETQTSRRVDEPGGKGDEGDDEESRLREVEGKEGDQSEDDGCQRDGRTNDAGDATSSASCDSLRVETDALADDEAGQQCNSKPRASTSSPEPSTPPTPFPYATRRPTHHVNPPRRRGRLKTLSTNVSRARAYGVRTTSNGRVDDHPGQLDATETVQGYWGSVPEPPPSRTKGTEAHTSTPHTVDITHTRELPYRVITPA